MRDETRIEGHVDRRRAELFDEPDGRAAPILAALRSEVAAASEHGLVSACKNPSASRGACVLVQLLRARFEPSGARQLRRDAVRVRKAIPAVRVTTVAQSRVACYVRSRMAAQGVARAGCARPRDRRRRELSNGWPRDTGKQETKMTDKTATATATGPARRKFLGAGVAGAAALTAPMISVAQSPIVLKMQGVVGCQGHLQRDGRGVRQARQRDGRRPPADRLPGLRRGGQALRGDGRGGQGRARRRPHACRCTGTARARSPRCSARVRSTAAMPTRRWPGSIAAVAWRSTTSCSPSSTSTWSASSRCRCRRSRSAGSRSPSPRPRS